MRRLTHKVGNDYISTNIDYGELIDIDDKEWKNFVEVVEKLGKLEEAYKIHKSYLKNDEDLKELCFCCEVFLENFNYCHNCGQRLERSDEE